MYIRAYIYIHQGKIKLVLVLNKHYAMNGPGGIDPRKHTRICIHANGVCICEFICMHTRG
jgi:hypothetical protein